MTHLTTTQILQTVDGTADYATQAAVTSHLAVCPECRKEMEFQRSLLRAVRRAPIPQVSQRFAGKVMGRIDPTSQRPYAAWVLNNMGSLFALMMVLGVVWLALTQPMTLSSTPTETQGAQIVEQWRQDLASGYTRLSESLKALQPVVPAERANAANGEGKERMVLIFVSLAVLVVLDRLWISRLRLRAKN